MPAGSYAGTKAPRHGEYSKNTYSYTDEQTIAARRPQRRRPGGHGEKRK
ncbi:MAG: riboflavin synthase subunit alpha, partial [Rothia mucilaginosa]